jgi:hypothetical protein
MADQKSKYIDLIERIGKIDLHLAVFGGFGEDAFLDHAMTRPHNDLDVLVLRNDLEQLRSSLKSLGFIDFEVYYEPLPENPLVLHSRNNGLDLEIGIADKDESGNHYFVTSDEHGEKQYKVTLTGNPFDFPPSTIDGVSIKTISPLAQYQIRAAFTKLNSFGKPESKHLAAQKRIKETFFPNKNEDELLPRIEEIESN